MQALRIISIAISAGAVTLGILSLAPLAQQCEFDEWMIPLGYSSLGVGYFFAFVALFAEWRLRKRANAEA